MSRLIHLHLRLLSSRCITSFSRPLVMQPPPLIVLRCCRLSRHQCLMSAGKPSWLSRCLLLHRRRLLSSQPSIASCLLTPPFSFSSCSPAGCCVVPVVAPPPPFVLSRRRLHFTTSHICFGLLLASWLPCHPCCWAASISALQLCLDFLFASWLLHCPCCCAAATS